MTYRHGRSTICLPSILVPFNIPCSSRLRPSQPEIEDISWWDFDDPAFIPHGGLVCKHGTPKESYTRLKGLLGHWRVMS